MSTATVEVGFFEQPNAEYHADVQSIGSTMLECFRRSPVEYHAKYVARTLRDEPTEAMRLGTALHALLLEADRFDELIAVEPKCDGRTNEGKAIRKAFNETSNGKTIITAEQNGLLTSMVKSALAHPQVAKLLRLQHKREQVVRWVDHDTGLPCKAKLDIVTDSALIADVKTAADPTPDGFERQAASLGRHRQNAHYRAGVEAVTGLNSSFMHIVIGTSEPFECACYFLDDAAVDLGRQQNRATLNRLAECIASEDFTAPQNREIQIRSLPKWVFYQD